MPQISAVVDAYIDANIILFAAFAVLCVMRWGLRRAGQGGAHELHLKLAEGMLVAALLSPFLAYIVAIAGARIFPDVPLNATDFAVAQFLDGRLQMNAVEFESLIGLRRGLVEDIVYLNGPIVQLGLALFAAGFAASVIATATEVIRLRRVIRSSFVWRRLGRVDLRLCDRARVPFSTRGLRRRHIIIPSDYLLHPETLRIALAHELQHMRRGDTEWEVLLVLARPLFFWNPVFILWKRQIETLRELVCDAALLDRGKVTPQSYAECLFAVCRKAISERQRLGAVAPSVPFMEVGLTRAGMRNREVLLQRMTAIVTTGGAGTRKGRLFWPVLLAATLMVAISAVAIQRHGDWSHDRLMLSTVVNLERMELRASSGLSLDGY